MTRFMGSLIFAIVSQACMLDTSGSAQTEAKFETITHGQALELEPHISSGQVTVFEVYADWCGPCKQMNQTLVDLKQTYGTRINIKKCDLVSFDSAFAQQQGIKDLPYLIVYDAKGQLLKRGPSVDVLPHLLSHLNSQ
ncbi:MAG: thioredoxin family protein [Acidobacteria bacterium]|nr:thioredoxin family protein [Acidobacteriota bacterium]MCB9398259.1 thioredoxin family protein [Acidobacteriota bacterium]